MTSLASFVPTEWLSEASRQIMITIVNRSHQSIWPSAEMSNFPSAQTLTLCINLYQRHFHDWLPVIERSTFKMEDSAVLIMMALAAIGAMYSRDNIKGLGIALSELVRRAIIFIVSLRFRTG